MPMFSEREKAIEQEFEHKQELRFKLLAKRNRLLGLWAAERMGLGREEAEAYALRVVDKEIVGRGDAAAVDKVAEDLAATGRPATKEQILSRLQAFESQARKEIAKPSRSGD